MSEATYDIVQIKHRITLLGSRAADQISTWDFKRSACYVTVNPDGSVDVSGSWYSKREQDSLWTAWIRLDQNGELRVTVSKPEGGAVADLPQPAWTACTTCRGWGYTKGGPGGPWEKLDCEPCHGKGRVPT